jgi:Arc/MetJ-type ribon-helix-helix transcriptional regulator
MPGAPRDSTRSAGGVERLSVTLTKSLTGEIEHLVHDTGYWLSVVDFIREATVEKLERWKRDHPPGPH